MIQTRRLALIRTVLSGGFWVNTIVILIKNYYDIFVYFIDSQIYPTKTVNKNLIICIVCKSHPRNMTKENEMYLNYIVQSNNYNF